MYKDRREIIGIIGVGVIGGALKKAYRKEKYNVICHDIKLNTKINDLLNTDIIFVCLPTPMNKDGSCNISIIKREMKKLSKIKYQGIVCVKSTIPPGTSKLLKKNYKLLRIVNCPEFLRERYAYKDFINYGLCIIGGENKRDIQIVKKIHRPFTNKFKVVSSTEAELIKYFHNTYNALRIVFANSYFNLSNFYSANYEKILDSVCLRNGYKKDYLKCNKSLRGFAGYCLPKDTNAIASIVKKNKLNLNIWSTIIKENNKFKKTVFSGMRK